MKCCLTVLLLDLRGNASKKKEKKRKEKKISTDISDECQINRIAVVLKFWKVSNLSVLLSIALNKKQRSESFIQIKQQQQ